MSGFFCVAQEISLNELEDRCVQVLSEVNVLANKDSKKIDKLFKKILKLDQYNEVLLCKNEKIPLVHALTHLFFSLEERYRRKPKNGDFFSYARRFLNYLFEEWRRLAQNNDPFLIRPTGAGNLSWFSYLLKISGKDIIWVPSNFPESDDPFKDYKRKLWIESLKIMNIHFEEAAKSHTPPLKKAGDFAHGIHLAFWCMGNSDDKDKGPFVAFLNKMSQILTMFPVEAGVMYFQFMKLHKRTLSFAQAFCSYLESESLDEQRSSTWFKSFLQKSCSDYAQGAFNAAFYILQTTVRRDRAISNEGVTRLEEIVKAALAISFSATEKCNYFANTTKMRPDNKMRLPISFYLVLLRCKPECVLSSVESLKKKRTVLVRLYNLFRARPEMSEIKEKIVFEDAVSLKLEPNKAYGIKEFIEVLEKNSDVTIHRKKRVCQTDVESGRLKCFLRELRPYFGFCGDTSV